MMSPYLFYYKHQTSNDIHRLCETYDLVCHTQRPPTTNMLE